MRRELDYIDVGVITIGDDRRPLNEAIVDALCDSIQRIGLQQPISVRVVNDGEEAHLITGRHRLEAFRRLGIEDIPAVIRDCDENEAKLWEIDENLIRADLSTDEKREHLRRRKELWEKRQADLQSAHHAPVESKRADGRGHRHKGFTADTAKKTGLSKSQINRLLAEPKPKPPREVKRCPHCGGEL